MRHVVQDFQVWAIYVTSQFPRGYLNILFDCQMGLGLHGIFKQNEYLMNFAHSVSLCFRLLLDSLLHCNVLASWLADIALCFHWKRVSPVFEC